MTDPLAQQIADASSALIDAIMTDDNAHGGLISRETIRKSDAVRVLLLRWRKRPPDEPAIGEPEPPIAPPGQDGILEPVSE